MMDGTGGPTNRPEVGELISHIWNLVIGQVNTLIKAHDSFGFVQFNENLNPSLEEVVYALAVVDSALTQFVESGLLGFDEGREAYNSKQCILKMKALWLASQAEDEAGFERIMDELKKQSKF